MEFSDDEEVTIFAPDEMRKLLAAANGYMLPFVAVGGFAGVRNKEIRRLTWDKVGAEFIDIKAGQAKTRSRRLVPIQPCLAAWLKPHRQTSGDLFPPGKNIENEIKRLAADAGVTWKRNALRHSFVSYRMQILKNESAVALEAGNSPTMIFKNYRELVTDDAAKEWFSIFPPA